MKLYTTIEIDEVETNIVVDFKMYFGQPEIIKITDELTGAAICPDIDDSNCSDDLYNEMCEFAANQELIPLENLTF